MASFAPGGVERERRFERLYPSFIAHFDGYLDQFTIRHLVAGNVVQDAKCGSTVVFEDAEKDPRTSHNAEASKAISAQSLNGQENNHAPQTTPRRRATGGRADMETRGAGTGF